LHVAFHPNTNDILSTTLGGSIYVWDQEASGIKGMIECKQDLLGGRLRDDRQASKNSTKNKHFNSIDISPNGEFVLGGGNSKNICLYDIKNKIMLSRYAITQNRSLDGVLLKLNSKNIKGEVADHELDIDSDLEEDAWQVRQAADSNMPGAKQKDNANVIKRSTKLAIRVKKIQFSPDGTQFACVTTEGLLIYSLA
jgi:periodic tryptophan protein 2